MTAPVLITAGAAQTVAEWAHIVSAKTPLLFCMSYPSWVAQLIAILPLNEHGVFAEREGLVVVGRVRHPLPPYQQVRPDWNTGRRVVVFCVGGFAFAPGLRAMSQVSSPLKQMAEQ